jgi:hypothetical protein
MTQDGFSYHLEFQTKNSESWQVLLANDDSPVVFGSKERPGADAVFWAMCDPQKVVRSRFVRAT